MNDWCDPDDYYLTESVYYAKEDLAQAKSDGDADAIAVALDRLREL